MLARSVGRVASRCKLLTSGAARRWKAVMPTSATAQMQQAAESATHREFETPSQQASSSTPVADLSDEEIMDRLVKQELPHHKLEQLLGDPVRAVQLRRLLLARDLAGPLSPVGSGADAAVNGLPSASFNISEFYGSIEGSNCENVIGYMPVPVGVAGPLVLDGLQYRVPMATTEGALVASTNRGFRAMADSGGATSVVHANGMTRAPLLLVGSAAEAAEIKTWAEGEEGFGELKAAFDSTSRFGRLQSIQVTTAGRNVWIRFKCGTGDAMGMNMITKGVAAALDHMKATRFPQARLLALSGNLCTDKKPAAINWVDGRGKSVTVECRIPADVVRSVLKTSTDRMVDLNVRKNLIGSAMAGSIGGFNAHASNLVTAVFLATGQDCAQNVESSQCLTLLEHDDTPGREGGMIASVTMPSIEVGTVGGGTSLPAQAACLEMLGVRGAHAERPGQNAEQLARIVGATVLAGELSLMAALTTDDLLSAHIKLNRKAPGVGGPDASAAEAAAAAGGAATAAAVPRGSVSRSVAAGSAFTSRGSGAPTQLLSQDPNRARFVRGAGGRGSGGPAGWVRQHSAASSPGRALFAGSSRSIPSSSEDAAAASLATYGVSGGLDEDEEGAQGRHSGSAARGDFGDDFPRCVVP